MSNATLTPPAAPAAQLDRLVELLDAAERAMAEAVLLAGQLAGSGAAEAVEGLGLEQFVGLRHRMPQTDVRMLITAGRVLGDMPVTGTLFADGKLSWGQVRRIALAVRGLSVERRGEVDARVDATVAEYGGVDAFDPDGLVDAVDDAVAEIRDRDRRRRRKPAEQDNYIAFQQRLDGGSKFHGEADAVTSAILLNALDAASPRPAGAGEPTPAGEPTRRGRQHLEGLRRLCADWLGGGPGRPARPLFVTHVDVSRPDPVGLLELGLRGKAPRIPAATLDILSRNADFRAVLFDRSRPLAVSDKLHADHIPTDIEIAVRARDLGCRFPASRDPLAHTDTHHINGRAGGHHPDELVRLSRRFHTITHNNGWQIELDPYSGQVTARRGKRTWKSLPRGTPLARPPNRPATPDDRAPPGMPF